MIAWPSLVLGAGIGILIVLAMKMAVTTSLDWQDRMRDRAEREGRSSGDRQP